MRYLNRMLASSSAMLLMALPIAGQAQTFSDISSTGSENIFSLMQLLFSGSAVVGFFLCIVGILYFKKDRQQQNQGHAGTGAMYLGVGVALLAIVFVIKLVLNSFGGSGDEGANRLKDSGWTSG